MAYMILSLLAMVHTVAASQSGDEVALTGALRTDMCRDLISECQHDVSQAQSLVAEFEEDIAKINKELKQAGKLIAKPFQNISNAQGDLRATSLVRGMDQAQAAALKSQVEKWQSPYRGERTPFNKTMLSRLGSVAEAVQKEETKSLEEYNALMTQLTTKTEESSTKLFDAGFSIGTLQQKMTDSQASLKHANAMYDAEKGILIHVTRTCEELVFVERSIHLLNNLGVPQGEAQAGEAKAEKAEKPEKVEKGEEDEKAEKEQAEALSENPKRLRGHTPQIQGPAALTREQARAHYEEQFPKIQRLRGHTPQLQGPAALARPRLYSF